MKIKLSVLEGVRHKDAKIDGDFQLMQLNAKQMKYVLKEFFNLHDKSYVCHYCKDKLKPKDIGAIMPYGKDEVKPLILCKSMVCMIEYYEDYLIDVDEEDEE